MQVEESNPPILEELARLKIDDTNGKPKVAFKKDDVVSVYKSNILANGYSAAGLAKLDRCNYLEQYLLPNYPAKSFKELDMSIVGMINYKFSNGVYIWDHFKEKNLTKQFTQLFNSILHIPKTEFEYVELRELVTFLILCFKHMEEDFISDETNKLLDITMWKLLSKDYLKSLFLKFPKFISLYKEIKSKEPSKEVLFIPSLVNVFWNQFVPVSASLDTVEPMTLSFFEKFVEFLCDILSQGSTRRELKFYLEDTKFVVKARLSKLYNHEKGKLKVNIDMSS